MLPFTTREESITSSSNTSFNGYAHSFAGMGVQYILFIALDAAIALLEERRRGLWKRIRTAPISRATILASKALSITIQTLFVLLAVFAFGMLVFGIRIQGSVVGFLLVCTSACLMAASFGLLLASLGRTPQATRIVSVFVVLVLAMLGGAWMPSFLFPSWLQKAGVLIPTRWAIDALDAMTWRGLGLADALPAVAALLTFAAVFSAIAWTRFRWDRE
jgi:ABC-2 type transport system permease protein